MYREPQLSRKRTQRQLLADVRAGLYDDILTGAFLPAPAPKPGPPPMEAIFGECVPVTRAEGRLLLRRLEVAPGDAPGAVRVPMPQSPWGEEDLAPPPLAARVLSADLADAEALRPSDVAFLDIETSGLHGAGAVAFLVALGWWEESPRRFVIEQYLAEDFPDELAVLAQVGETLARFRAVAHYNGRTFDMPVLQSRFVMNRLRPKPLSLPQIDLLPFSRRLWRGALPSLSLKSVEARILLHDRGPDVDGAEIPGIFHDFARSGARARMALVLHHNAQDVATLPALLAFHCAALRDPAPPRLTRWTEFAAMARLAGARKEHLAAAALWEHAAQRTDSRDAERACLVELAHAYRRGGDAKRAVEAWRAVARGPFPHALPAAIAASRIMARQGDRAAALHELESVRRRLELEADLELMTGRGTGATKARERLGEDLQRRIARMAARTSGQSGPR
jgi:uncharacterized protein YprB with RNaseH-like and TPR domain